MVPIMGMDVYQSLIEANAWAKELLPNCSHDFAKRPAGASRAGKATELATAVNAPLEFPLRGRIGGRFEEWEMTRKIKRLSLQDGFGEETIFSAEVCQGNFHHHRKWTRQAFEKKMIALAAVLGEPELTQSPSTAIGADRA
jgi:hypothetical protein